MMNRDDIDHLKDLADDLEVAFEHMKAEGYTDENNGYIWAWRAGYD